MVLRLALDTGATSTLINTSLLVAIRYDLTLATDRVEMTTGSGVEFAPVIDVSELSALGKTNNRFSVLGHMLPPSAGVDGLLGLDFFRGHVLTIDFPDKTIHLS